MVCVILLKLLGVAYVKITMAHCYSAKLTANLKSHLRVAILFLFFYQGQDNPESSQYFLPNNKQLWNFPL